MTRPLLLLAALVGLLPIVHANTVTLNDSFNGSTIDSSVWTAKAPFSDSSTVETGGNLVLSNKGGMLTNIGFSDPVDMLMAFQFTGSTYDSFKIIMRTDGDSTNSNLEVDSGIVVSFRMQSDGGDTTNNVLLYDENYPVSFSPLATGTFGMTTDQTYLIRLLDTGSSVSLYINDLSTPFLTAATTSSYGDQIAFDNREGAGHGSGISAGSQVSIDFVSITSNVPDMGATALYLAFGIALLGVAKKTSAISALLI
jgi:hypothetical protein